MVEEEPGWRREMRKTEEKMRIGEKYVDSIKTKYCLTLQICHVLAYFVIISTIYRVVLKQPFQFYTLKQV